MWLRVPGMKFTVMGGHEQAKREQVIMAQVSEKPTRLSQVKYQWKTK